MTFRVFFAHFDNKISCKAAQGAWLFGAGSVAGAHRDDADAAYMVDDALCALSVRTWCGVVVGCLHLTPRQSAGV